MKQTVNFYDFVDAFQRAGRAEQFSYEAKRMIFDHLEEFESESGEELELDVIAICCDFEEATEEEVIYNYECEDARQYLEENTVLLGETKEGTFVYVQF
jgi:hypothetical protein